MSFTAADASLARYLREEEGASPFEVAIVLSVVRELDVIELSDAWRHELRGPHGEWARGGGRGGTTFVERQARQQRRARENALIKAAKVAPVDIEQLRQEHRAMANEVARNHAEHVMAQAQEEIAKSAQMLQKAQEQKERQSHRVKLAVHMLVIAAGAVLAAVLASMAAPAVLAALGAGIPLAVQELVDWKKKL